MRLLSVTGRVGTVLTGPLADKCPRHLASDPSVSAHGRQAPGRHHRSDDGRLGGAGRDASRALLVHPFEDRPGQGLRVRGGGEPGHLRRDCPSGHGGVQELLQDGVVA